MTMCMCRGLGTKASVPRLYPTCFFRRAAVSSRDTRAVAAEKLHLPKCLLAKTNLIHDYDYDYDYEKSYMVAFAMSKREIIPSSEQSASQLEGVLKPPGAVSDPKSTRPNPEMGIWWC